MTRRPSQMRLDLVLESIMRSHGIGILFLFLAVGAPSVSIAVEWRGAVDAAQIYTDNLTLAPDGFKEDAWVTRIEPSIGVSIDAERLELDFDYALETLIYADDSDRNGVFSNLSTYGIFNLINDELWLRGSGAIDQVNVDPAKRLTHSNINVTGNRSDSAIWNIGPVWQRPLFSKAELDASFMAGRVSYDKAEAQDVKTLAGQAAIRRATTNPGDVGYELMYEFSKLDYDISGDVEVQSLYLQLGYQVNEAFQLNGLIGIDSDFRDLDDSSLSESRWEVGFSRAIGKNEFTLSVGERFWGSTYFFEWNRQQSDNFHMRVAYNETPSTADIVALNQVPTGDEDTGFDSPDSDLNRPGTARRFIRKRGDAGVDWTYPKTTFYLGLCWEQRDNFEAATDTTPVPDEDSFGATASFSWDLGYKTMFSMSLTSTQREIVVDSPLPGGGITLEDDTLLQGTAGFDYEWGQRTFLFLEARYNDRTGATTGVGNYKEFSAELGLTREF